MLGHRADMPIGYTCGPRMGPIDNFSLVTGPCRSYSSVAFELLFVVFFNE